MTTWTRETIAEWAGPCPGCGKPFNASWISNEDVALANSRGKPFGPRGTFWCDPCLQKTEAERLADAKARVLDETRRRLSYCGHWDEAAQACRFDTSRPEIERKEPARIDAFAQAKWWRPGKANLWIASHGHGTGKTFLACCIGNAVLDDGGEPCLLHAAQITHLAKGWDSGGNLTAPCEATLLILDDIDKADLDPRVSSWLFHVLDARHNHQLNTIVTSNSSAKELYARWSKEASANSAGQIRGALDRLNWPDKLIQPVWIDSPSIRTSVFTPELAL